MRNRLVVATLVVVLGVVNWSVRGKEAHLAQGAIVYLEIAPIDPRSLVQGDYMALNFRMANDVQRELTSRANTLRSDTDTSLPDGHVVVSLDERGVGSFDGIYDGQSLEGDQLLMRYRVRGERVRFATNAFFFEEGTASRYESARYGEFRVDEDGELLLVALHDEELTRLGPQ